MFKRKNGTRKGGGKGGGQAKNKCSPRPQPRFALICLRPVIISLLVLLSYACFGCTFFLLSLLLALLFSFRRYIWGLLARHTCDKRCSVKKRNHKFKNQLREVKKEKKTKIFWNMFLVGKKIMNYYFQLIECIRNLKTKRLCLGFSLLWSLFLMVWGLNKEALIPFKTFS